MVIDLVSYPTINVELTPEEEAEYEKNYKAFTGYLEENRIWLNSPIAFQRFIMRSSRDPQARQALLARNRALSVAFNSEAKLDRLEEILHSNPEDRILIFTQHNDLVYKISRRPASAYQVLDPGDLEREKTRETDGSRDRVGGNVGGMTKAA